MAKSTRETSVVAFMGMPDDFRRAHRAELKAIHVEAHWINHPRELGRTLHPVALVLNIDDPLLSTTALWESLRSRFPHAELIALSGRDSAQQAMHCLREGFADFLTQPVGQDELALCLLRHRQRADSARRPAFPGGDLSRALTLLSSSSSVATLRTRTAATLKQLLHASSVEWTGTRVRSGRGRQIFSFEKASNGRFIVEKANLKASRRAADQVEAVLEHAELALMGLKRIERLKRQTFIDDLTGLYNSRYLRFALEAASVQSQQKNEPFGLLFIDVDRFKSVNDQHGHLVGSEFLSALGKIIKNAVRGGDFVFRYGGDEFVTLLRNAGIARCQQIGERLRRQIENRGFVIRGARLKTTVSIGLAVFPDHHKNLDQLIALADEAMYAAKKQRNQVKVAGTPSPRPSRPRPPEPSL